jgi:hypothetical protein
MRSALGWVDLNRLLSIPEMFGLPQNSSGIISYRNDDRLEKGEDLPADHMPLNNG